MPLYQVMTPFASPDPLDTVYVKERFSWFAFLLPPVWALTHRLWLEALGWLVVVIVIGALSLLIGDEAVGWLYLLFALWIGFSAPDLRIASLLRRGYVQRGAVAADDELAAETIYLQGSAA